MDVEQHPTAWCRYQDPGRNQKLVQKFSATKCLLTHAHTHTGIYCERYFLMKLEKWDKKELTSTYMQCGWDIDRWWSVCSPYLENVEVRVLQYRSGQFCKQHGVQSNHPCSQCVGLLYYSVIREQSGVPWNLTWCQQASRVSNHFSSSGLHLLLARQNVKYNYQTVLYQILNVHLCGPQIKTDGKSF